MIKSSHSALDFLPKKLTLSSLQTAAKSCRGCPLYKKATQTVFGEGAARATLFVVGEIPGDKEDILGKPFRGPAGNFLRQAIETSEIDFEDIYFTNVVKHFKFEILKNRRMHRSPVGSEIRACFPWLEAEIKVVQPKIILCLGSIAAKALVSKAFHVHNDRGKWFERGKLKFLVTFHPSAILRANDSKSRAEMKNIFLKDLHKIARALKKIHTI